MKSNISDISAQCYVQLLDLLITKIRKTTDCVDMECTWKMLMNLGEKYNYPSALGVYGWSYLQDDKEWYDNKKGVKYILEAAEKGDPCSQYLIAKIYYTGSHNITQDSIKGHYWLEKAKNNGYRPAIEEWNMRYEDK